MFPGMPDGGARVRLAICNALGETDCSPTELAEAIGRPKNLVAYHLGLLRAAGMADWRRSDGDGRQKYVSLTGEGRSLFHLRRSEQRTSPVRNPAFLCWNGADRSQLAAAIWQALTGDAANAFGLLPTGSVHPGVAVAAKKVGIPFEAFRPMAIRGPMTNYNDAAKHYVANGPTIVLCDRVWERRVRDCLPLSPRVLHWSIPDPRQTARTTQDHRRVKFGEVVGDLLQRCEHAAGFMRSPTNRF